MKSIEVGEWIKGPFANATIEGFVVGRTGSTYIIQVETIERHTGQLPDYLREGSVHELPRKVVYEFFRILNNDQQRQLVNLAVKLEQIDWALELTKKFTNDKSDIEKIPILVEHIFSPTLNRRVSITAFERKRLYSYYLKAVQKGMKGSVKSPEDMIDPTNFDAIISAIVLVANDPEGAKYIETLLTDSSESVN